jgi:hypothetical protein
VQACGESTNVYAPAWCNTQSESYVGAEEVTQLTVYNLCPLRSVYTLHGSHDSANSIFLLFLRHQTEQGTRPQQGLPEAVVSLMG